MTPPLPIGPFDVVLADPPWRYQNYRNFVEKHYRTMSLDEICFLGPSVPAAERSVLFLWATAPKLDDAMIVMLHWGFEYKTCAAWDKGHPGVGFWFRGQHELLLVGVRGKMSPTPKPHRLGSIFRAPRRRHSEKPAAVQDWIDRAWPTARKLEMFARQRREGWAPWGDQVDVDNPGPNGQELSPNSAPTPTG